MYSSTIITKQTWQAWAIFLSVDILEKGSRDWTQPRLACRALPPPQSVLSLSLPLNVIISTNSSVCAHGCVKFLLRITSRWKDAEPLREVGSYRGCTVCERASVSLNSGDTVKTVSELGAILQTAKDVTVSVSIKIIMVAWVHIKIFKFISLCCFLLEM